MAQRQHRRAATGAPAPLPVQGRRTLTRDDTVKAYAKVKIQFAPVRKDAPGVENTYFKFKKRRDGTGDDDADLIKRQAYNCCNLLGNKRREIIWYLPATKKKAAHMEKLLNDLQGLEHKLRYKLEEFRAFMPDSPMQVPAHFLNLPALKKPKK